MTYKRGRSQMRIPCCVFDLGVVSIKRLRRAIALSTTSRVYLPNLEVAPSIHTSREQMPQQHLCNTGMPPSSTSLQTYCNQVENCFGQPPVVSPAFIILIVMCIGAFALATTTPARQHQTSTVQLAFPTVRHCILLSITTANSKHS
jgi:hypothetical protein